MQTTHLGRSGLVVSRLCLGTMNFGAEINAKQSHALLDAALEAGVFFVDTANAYGGKAGHGATEEIIGSWLAAHPARRRQVVLATKLYGDAGPGANDKKLSARHVRDACEDSLRRLKTDHIDLYQMHHVDLGTPWEETWQALELLIQQGKVLYVGSSNFAGWQLSQMQASARERGLVGLVSEQSHYNLALRTCELEVLPACRHMGLGFLPWSPLENGVLAGILARRGEAGGKPAKDGRRVRENLDGLVAMHRDKLERFETLCAGAGSDPATVALAWLLHQPGVTAPVVGPRTREQLQSALAATELELDAEALRTLDEIWPGPGEAPMAYAW